MSDVDNLRARLISAREAARSGAEVLTAIADIEWYNACSESCPDNRIPTLTDLGEWLPECPPEVEFEATRLLKLTAGIPPDATVTTDEGYSLQIGWDRFRRMQLTTKSGEVLQEQPDPERPPGGLAAILPFEYVTVAELHQLWRSSKTQPRHPLAPLVDAWQQRPPPAEWDSREHPVLSGTLAGRAGGVRPLVVANDPRQLPLDLSGGSEPPRQLWLGFEQPEPDRVPVLPLVAYDRRGGVSMTSGAGAAHAIRLYVEALLAVPPERRVDERPFPLRAKLRDVVKGLWPRGWQRGRDWPRLLAGLDELRRLGVEWEHNGVGGVWFTVTIRTMPRAGTALDDLLQFEVLLPPGSGPGPMVARAHLRLLGLDSAPAYRLYLSLCWLWDHYGTTRGRLIGADPPQRPGKPVKGIEVGGHLVNPAALRRYPALTPDHLAVMSYAPADLAPERSSYRRDQRQRARKALDRIVDQTGALVIPSPATVPDSVQVLPPASHKAAHDGKAELWQHLNRRGPNHGATLG